MITSSAPIKNVTTVFADDGAIAAEDYKVSVVTDDMVIKDQAIADFLAKPILIKQTSWASTDLINANLWAVSPGAALSANAIWANKIQGYAYMRGTAVLRVQINANPFQQGRLLIHFLPLTQQISVGDPSYFYMHNTQLISKSMQPHVELDCRDTSAIIKIPYVSPTNWFSLKTALYDWGTFYVDVFAALATGTASDATVDVSIWLSFEDFELAGPTFPQMAGKGGKRFKVSTLKEETAMEGGPISRALAATSSIASALEAVPFLASVAAPVAWVTGALSGVAGYFGWSKPETNQGGTVMINQFGRYAATSDGLDPSIPLGLISNNGTKVTSDITIRSEDEMSFNFLKTFPAYIRQINWPDTTITNNSLYSAVVGPTSTIMFDQFTRNVSGHITTYNIGPPAYYLSKRFALWRGSLCFTFKLIKTQYHTGRLQVSFTPGDAATAINVPGTLNGEYSLREIIDISEGNEFCMHVPFLMPTNYVANGTTMGKLDITVVNQLRRPDNCSSSITIMVFANAGDDFELQIPYSGSADVPYSPQMGGPIKMQMDMGQCESIVTDTVGSADIPSRKLVYAEMSAGENFASVKQLLNRNSQLMSRTGAPTLVSGLLAWPWFCNVAYTAAAGFTANPWGGDAYSIFAPMYCMYRGSVRLTVGSSQAYTTGVNPGVATVYGCQLPRKWAAGTAVMGTEPALLTPGQTGTQEWATGDYMGLTGVAIQNPQLGFSSWKLPYISTTKCSLLCTQSTVAGIPNEPSQARNMLCIQSKGQYGDYTVMRSFCDDFQLAYFVGAPPVYVSTT
jgi:hypothetical protein